MHDATISQEVWDVIHLASCAVNQTAPDTNRIMSMNLDAVYSIARRHMLLAACAISLENAGVVDDRFVKAKYKAIRKTMLMDTERKNLFRSMDERDIWYLPLKGCVLKDYYPVFGMREMSDNDILFDEERASDVRDILETQGFETVSFGLGAHDVYHKAPSCSFEMHRKLFGGAGTPAMRNYFNSVKDMMISDDDGSCGYHLRDEDFYIYTIAHEYKHYLASGTGLKSLLDTYVLLNSHSSSFDWESIACKTKEIGLFDFEARNRELSLSVFSRNGQPSNDISMLSYIIESGSYGTSKLRITNEVSRMGRIGYLIYRAFPPYSSMADMYPALRKRPILLPSFWLYRIASAITSKPQSIIETLQTTFHNTH